MTASPLPAQTELRDAFWRSLHALNVTRIVIAGLLLSFWLLGDVRESAISSAYPNVCLIYLVTAVLFAMITIGERRHFQWQLLTQIAVDILMIALLYLSSGGMRGGMAILFLFPLASSAILVQMTLGLFSASVVTLFLLADNWFRMLRGQPDAYVMQAGLYGAAFFASAYVVNRLADRLIRQENLAQQRGMDLKLEQAINSLVIADMDDGVLVVGDDGSIFACNPAAEKKLCISMQDIRNRPTLRDVPYLMPLAEAFATWQQHQHAALPGKPSPVAYFYIKPTDEAHAPELARPETPHALGTHLKARFAAADAESLPKGRSVIFLQDVARIEHQAQELKLASMGRLTASIAHEVRNPLAAIAHASALLDEEANTPAQQRLLRIVADNVARMNRMIEEILNLSRKAQSREDVWLPDMVTEVVASFEQIHPESAGSIHVGPLGDHPIRFDPVHLREILLNLLNNAVRYASGRPGSIRIHASLAAPNRVEMHVQDDGPGITPEVRAHLFEPFYTTSSKGTGLGLYLARELCSNNGALLDYEFHPDDSPDRHGIPSGRFVLTFAASDMTQKGISRP